ncbi:LTA synthase family protein [Bacillus suaedae]|uniref:LTA synthase family protein n=1 Tax=Halalkalibacter suaedae TaxID=2822140 RepID=A0A940WXN5_9BACI|nr:LTA synthase family protein [Bacillus suaedae]MBP3953648.1 LTA synthase family protein [Bacillus suaedae]
MVRSFFFMITLLSLLIKSTIMNVSLFNEWNVLTLLYDACTYTVILLLVSLLFKRLKRCMYLILNFILTTSILATIMYYDYYQSILTFASILQINQLIAVTDSIYELFSWTYMFFYIDVLFFSLFFYFTRQKTSTQLIEKNILPTKMWLLTMCISSSLFNIFLNESIVNEYERAKSLGIFQYQVVTFCYDNYVSVVGHPAFDPAVLKNLGIEGIEEESKDFFGVAKGMNVIVVQLEAFQQFPLGLIVDGQEVTPHLNEFLAESLSFDHFYQQIGKGNTSDAEFIANTSIYPVGDRPISELISSKEVPSLPRLLNDLDYTTTTFHTNDVAFWSRDDLYPALGFDQYYDKSFFKDEDFIQFGSSDEILFRKSVEELADIHAKGDLFYAHLVAMSSHHPFTLPREKYKHIIKLPPRFDGTMVGKYLEATSYTDYAFGQLLNTLKDKGLYDSTLIALYGDHYGLNPETKQDTQLMKELLGREYHSLIDKYKVPFILHVPSLPASGVYQNTGGQIDIMPTLLNLLGIDVNVQSMPLFGRDLFNSSSNLVGSRYYTPTGTYYNEDYLYMPGKSFEDGTFIDLDTHEVQPAMSFSNVEYQRLLKLLDASDSYFYSLER